MESQKLPHPKCSMSEPVTTMFGIILYGPVAVLISSCCRLMLLQYVGAECLSRCDRGWSWGTVRALKVGWYVADLVQQSFEGLAMDTCQAMQSFTHALNAFPSKLSLHTSPHTSLHCAGLCWRLCRIYSCANLRHPQLRQVPMYEAQTHDCARLVIIVYSAEGSLGGGGNGSPAFFWCHQATTKGSAPPVITMVEIASPHFSFLWRTAAQLRLDSCSTACRPLDGPHSDLSHVGCFIRNGDE